MIPLAVFLGILIYGVLMYLGGYGVATLYWTGKTPAEHRADGTHWIGGRR